MVHKNFRKGPEHIFSQLAQPPYRFVGLETTEDRAALNSHRKAEMLTYTTNLCGGSCDACGTAIFDVYRFLGADGKGFKLGSSCMKKVGPKFTQRALSDANAARLAKERDKRHKRAAGVLALAVLWFEQEENQQWLRERPHRIDRMAEQGFTAFDWWVWMFDNAGNKGKIDAWKWVQKEQKAQEADRG